MHYLDVCGRDAAIKGEELERPLASHRTEARTRRRDHSIISSPISRKLAPRRRRRSFSRAIGRRGRSFGRSACDVGGNGGYEMHICSELRIGRTTDERRVRREGGSGFTRSSRIRLLDSGN